ncbi:copper homeostasis protein CutC [unidentified bacterial endosymbiont]|uniref:copper homeostasis protein CutC n=1 Tax=unidentified bacterial endosymbiont TaxID=2355 RepID=UPI0020A1B960|nr:copper homeostasis protein CutC [unidentified bacterial endosymbiont]
MALLEICCYSVECAVTAQQRGADRIELCAAPKEGGLTPSYGVLKSAREAVTVPVHPIIRPRGGDFCYTAGEFSAMLEDIARVGALGFPGLVIGLLDEDGNVDLPRMCQVMHAAKGMDVTFHRAFDMCRNPFQAVDMLMELGVARILTSGQQPCAEKGLQIIMELKAHSGAIKVMAGAGVRASNLELFLNAGVEELHSSAGQWIPSPMRYRNTGLSMSTDAKADEYSRYGVDGESVAVMKSMIEHYHV